VYAAFIGGGTTGSYCPAPLVTSRDVRLVTRTAQDAALTLSTHSASPDAPFAERDRWNMGCAEGGGIRFFKTNGIAAGHQIEATYMALS
jgi:hypothetical protein